MNHVPSLETGSKSSITSSAAGKKTSGSGGGGGGAGSGQNCGTRPGGGLDVSSRGVATTCGTESCADPWSGDKISGVSGTPAATGTSIVGSEADLQQSSVHPAGSRSRKASRHPPSPRSEVWSGSGTNCRGRNGYGDGSCDGRMEGKSGQESNEVVTIHVCDEARGITTGEHVGRAVVYRSQILSPLPWEWTSVA